VESVAERGCQPRGGAETGAVTGNDLRWLQDLEFVYGILHLLLACRSQVCASDKGVYVLFASEFDCMAQRVDHSPVGATYDYHQSLAGPSNEGLLFREFVSDHACTTLDGEVPRYGLEVRNAGDCASGQDPGQDLAWLGVQAQHSTVTDKVLRGTAHPDLSSSVASSSSVLGLEYVGVGNQLAWPESAKQQWQGAGVVVVRVAEHDLARLCEVEPESSSVTHADAGVANVEQQRPAVGLDKE
jgi:hypothetical protein